MAAVSLTRGQDERARAFTRESEGLRRALPAGAPNPPFLQAEGEFERGLIPPWGTGHYESGNFNFGIWWNSTNCRSYAKLDSAVTHSGQASLRLTSFSPSAANVFGTTSQRIRGIAPNTLYEVSVWARAENLSPGAVQLIMDAGWHLRPLTLPPGTYDWKQFTARFNSQDLAFIDLRVLLQSTGTVWLDDLSLRRLDSAEVVGDPLLAAEDLFRRGQVRQALALYREQEKALASQPERLPPVWLRMAGVLAAMGEYGPALELYEKVRSPTHYRVYLAVGDIYLNLDQPDKALEQFQYVHRKVSKPLDQAMLAEASDRMAVAYLRMGNLPEAIAFQSQALQIMTHINDPHGRSHNLCHLGQIYLQGGQVEAARECFESALPLTRATGDRRLESDVLTQRAILQGGPAALQDLAEAIRLRREIYDRYGLIASLYWQGHFQARLGDRKSALASLEEAADLLESVKDSVGTRNTMLKSSQDLYEELIRLYHEEGRPEDALQALARSRSDNLRHLFKKQGSPVASSRRQALQTSQALQGEREAVERSLQQELTRTPVSQDPAAVESARGEREKRLVEYREFVRDLFQTQPELAGLISVNPKQLRLKQGTLGPDEAIVEYLCGQKQLYVFCVTANDLEARIVDLPREELSRRVGELRTSVLRGDEQKLRQESNRLYRDLLGPVEARLQGVKTLSILPNGPLHYLPFQLLAPDLSGPDWLVDRMACVNLCEESFLVPPAPSATPRRLLLLGNPDGSLPRSENEVRRIAELFPGSTVYVGPAARKELVGAAARGYEGLHIASHGMLDQRDAARSYILLAPDRLTVREIWGLDLKGLGLVTLSACQTGLGENGAGDDLISLENAFFFAGAESVVASLWKVDDDATARLMTEFYANLKTMSRARALQEAQKTIKQTSPGPYFWAPFILIGPSS